MKKDVLGTVIMIALGFVAVGLFLAAIWPLINIYILDAVSKKPTIPTASIIQQIPDNINNINATGLNYFL